MKLYSWDEIENRLCEVTHLPGPSCTWRHVLTYQNGVQEYRSDRNHVSLEVEAVNLADANRRMFEASEDYRNMAGPAA